MGCAVLLMGLNRIRRAGAEKASGPLAFSGVVESEAGANEADMDDKPKDYYRVFAPGVPNYRDASERFTSEADARRRKWEILMAYPAATVRIEKTDESGRAR